MIILEREKSLLIRGRLLDVTLYLRELSQNNEGEKLKNFLKERLESLVEGGH